MGEVVAVVVGKRMRWDDAAALTAADKQDYFETSHIHTYTFTQSHIQSGRASFCCFFSTVARIVTHTQGHTRAPGHHWRCTPGPSHSAAGSGCGRWRRTP